MAQRDKLNRELIRLSFISSKAMHKDHDQQDSALMDEKEYEASSSSSTASHTPSPVPTPTEAEDGIITEPTIKLKPKMSKQYPITPPPPQTHRAVDALKVNISSNTTKSLDAVGNNTPSFHARFHTHAGFETPDHDEDKKGHNSAKKKTKKKKNDRRNSENALFRMKITSPQVMKQSIYTRNEKFVRIADLMIPDANVDKLRCQSRRGSHVSTVGGDHTRESTSYNPFHMNSPSVVRIDPSDPSAYENLDFAKSIPVRQWNADPFAAGDSSGYLHAHAGADVATPGIHIHTPTNGQLSQMIRNQEQEHDKNLKMKNMKVNSSSVIPDAAAAKDAPAEDLKYEERINEKGMKLRDFKSPDGDIIFTEIEVSVLGTGNFFGETSLMEEAEENEDDFEDLPTAATPTVDEIEIDIGAAEPVLVSKPSVLDIINRESTIKQDETGAKHAIAPSSSYMQQQKKKKIVTEKEANKTYRGSHTTFRCLSGCVIYSITKQSIDEFFRMVPSARPWFDIMLSKYNVSLDTVLHIPRAARYFTLFLESEYAQENIHYVLSVNEYRDAYDSVDAENQMEMAQIICDHFISDQGSQQINVSYQQRKAILDRIAKKDIDKFIFDSTQKAIYTLLQRDCFPRFKQSHFFHEFLNEAENLALLTKEQYEMHAKEEQNTINENRKHSKLLKTQSVFMKNRPKHQSAAFIEDIDDDENENNILKQRAKTFT
eukprot:87828_1